MRKLFSNVDWKVLLTLVGLMVPVVFLWDTWAVYPLKILVVFFHELSHGLAALVTGGKIDRIALVAQEGGFCYTMGGSRFIILSAGYLGSLVFGGLVLLLAARTRWDRGVAIALGGVVLLVTALFMRPVLSFGFGFGLATAAVLVVSGWKLPEVVNDYLLRAVGLTSCLYAVLDIKSDILDRPEALSDAAMLSELTGMPTRFWGGIWIAIAVLAALVFLVLACKRRPAPTERAAPAAAGAKP
jgi:hypothetical protein